MDLYTPIAPPPLSGGLMRKAHKFTGSLTLTAAHFNHEDQRKKVVANKIKKKYPRPAGEDIFLRCGTLTKQKKGEVKSM